MWKASTLNKWNVLTLCVNYQLICYSKFIITLTLSDWSRCKCAYICQNKWWYSWRYSWPARMMNDNKMYAIYPIDGTSPSSHSLKIAFLQTTIWLREWNIELCVNRLKGFYIYIHHAYKMFTQKFNIEVRLESICSVHKNTKWFSFVNVVHCLCSIQSMSLFVHFIIIFELFWDPVKMAERVDQKRQH